MNHEVFISYSSKNSNAAKAVCHHLENNQIRCWMAPRDIPPGFHYGDLIDQAIIDCQVFVIIYSMDALHSQYVNGELNIAFEEQKTIIPYKIDNSQWKGAMRLILNQTHWIDAYPNYEETFNTLLISVQYALGKKPTEDDSWQSKSQHVEDNYTYDVPPQQNVFSTKHPFTTHSLTEGSFKITDYCVACGLCIDECPVGAISEGDIYIIDPDTCVACGTCAAACPNEAIIEN